MAYRRLMAPVVLGIALGMTGCGDDGGPGGGGGTDAGGGGTGDGGGGGVDAGGGGGTDAGGGGGTDAGGATTDGGSTASDGSTPTTPGGIGSACDMDDDCDGDATCYTTVGSGMFGLELPGGYCSKECTAGSGSTECGAGSDCYSIGFGMWGVTFCAKTCATEADCRGEEGYTCRMPPLGGGTTKYCLPPTGGLPDGGFGFDGSFPGFDGSIPGT